MSDDKSPFEQQYEWEATKYPDPINQKCQRCTATTQWGWCPRCTPLHWKELP